MTLRLLLPILVCASGCAQGTATFVGQRQGAMIGGGIAAGVAGAGAVLSVSFGLRGRKQLATLGSFDAAEVGRAPTP